jgi:hypothetical protein
LFFEGGQMKEQTLAEEMVVEPLSLYFSHLS